MISSPDSRTGSVVTADALTRTFGDFVAVDRVSFDVAPGEIFGFLGSNGAGKTTAIRMLCGLLAPTSGHATVAGFDVATQAKKIQTRIGYMSQRFSLYTDLTVDENLRFWAGAYQVWGRRFKLRRDWAVEKADLKDRTTALVRDLPGGYRQRLALACALLHEPPVVFLDEPTGGVDPEARRRFWDLIDELSTAGTTVFVTTHFMDEAERCHRVALMHAGKLLALDQVPRLKTDHGPGAVFEIRCNNPARALDILEGHDEIDDSALFGDRLRAATDNPDLRADLITQLETAGHGPVSAQTVEPSLEDVFIRVIRNADHEVRAA